jgi:hypothetical protein
VVSRGPYLDPTLFESLRPHRRPELPEKYYEVRAELRSPTHDPVLLAARVRVEDGTKPDKGSVVVEALIEPGKIVLAMAEGSDLFVWQVGPGLTCWSQLGLDKTWSVGAAPRQVDKKNVAMKLARTKDGRLSVEVIESRFEYGKHHTVYEEAERMSPRLKWVRDWAEKGASSE